METCFTYIDKEDAFFSSDERKWITRIKKLAEKFPDKVVILKQPEENDGCIYARLAQDTLKINVIRRQKKTDEELSILRERMKSLRKSQLEALKEKQHD